MNERSTIPVLSIAGSDCSGGAGIQADIKTISAHGCYAMAAITSITAQNTTGVFGVEGISPSMVAEQIRAVFSDIRPAAVKTGMLFDEHSVKAVAGVLREVRVDNLVVDPVMVSTSGRQLLSEAAADVLVQELFPLAVLVTPNRHEAEVLTGESEPMEQGRKLIKMGCKAVLIKGGDSDDAEFKTDILMTASGAFAQFRLPAVDTINSHGTGCTLASAIASNLAKGYSLLSAVENAKRYVYNALLHGSELKIGHGHGPVNHFYNVDFRC